MASFAEKLRNEDWFSNPLWISVVLVFINSAIALKLQGRIWWCANDSYTPWSSDIWGRHNSQHLFDPYTFTHILHGFLYCALTALVFPKMKLGWRFFVALVIGALWELLENSVAVIERYRAVTISLDYFGDSILNSLADIFSCGLGFIIAHKLGWWRGAIYFLLTEIILLFWIHDSLIVNIIMLIHPIEAIKNWQLPH
jgi:hypothetical protein